MDNRTRILQKQQRLSYDVEPYRRGFEMAFVFDLIEANGMMILLL